MCLSGIWKGEAYVSKGFPVALDLFAGDSPLFADDFRDLGIGEAWVLCDDGGLIMLAVENKSWEWCVSQELIECHSNAQKPGGEWIEDVYQRCIWTCVPFLGLGTFGSG